MKNLRVAAVLLVLLTVMGACVPFPLFVGGASGGAVYSSTSDHIEDVFNISKEQAFETIIGLVAKDDGQIKVSSITEGKIQAGIGKTLLYVNITPIDDMTIKVSFRAKKHIELIPDKEASVRYYRAFVKEVMK
ncbi:MAG: hypothetical protein C0603_02245 [Denitrovibrio sp.]|nr:MAG: hypothetical protein C0603_02245 [Denitrovibrio sp.]